MASICLGEAGRGLWFLESTSGAAGVNTNKSFSFLATVDEQSRKE